MRESGWWLRSFSTDARNIPPLLSDLHIPDSTFPPQEVYSKIKIQQMKFSGPFFRVRLRRPSGTFASCFVLKKHVVVVVFLIPSSSIGDPKENKNDLKS